MARIKPQALLIQSKKKKSPSRISIATIITCNLIVILILFSLYATYKHWYPRLDNEPAEKMEGLEHSESLAVSKKYDHDLPSYAILSTSKGSIAVELDKDSSPEIVDKFIDLCQKGHFKGLPFHRVIKNYVIEGGDLKNLGAAEDWTLKLKANRKFGISSKHEAFMIGTIGKTGGQGFDIFITTAPIPELNDKLIVFGRVIEGEDVVQEIEEVDTDEHYRPKSPIVIVDIILKKAI